MFTFVRHTGVYYTPRVFIIRVFIIRRSVNLMNTVEKLHMKIFINSGKSSCGAREYTLLVLGIKKKKYNIFSFLLLLSLNCLLIIIFFTLQYVKGSIIRRNSLKCCHVLGDSTLYFAKYF